MKTIIYLDMYDNIVILEDGIVAGVVGKKSLTKLISLLGIKKIVELGNLAKPSYRNTIFNSDSVKPDFVVENDISQKVKED